MKRRLLALFLFAAAGSGVGAGEETNRAAGGGQEELRAVLEMDASQTDRLRTAFRAADQEFQRMRDGARARGGQPAIEELIAWQDRLRDAVRGVLNPNQVSRYDGWLERKRRLGEEYDKALFGIPTPTELKVKLGFSPETLDKEQKIADEGVDSIRRKMVEMRTSGSTVDEIGSAVNDLRKETIRKEIEAASGAEQRKIRDWLKTWLKAPAEKLSRTEFDRLERVMKGLELADGAQSGRIQALVASVLWHMEENAGLRRGLGKELVMAILRQKGDAEVWVAIYEYGTLIDIHARRIKALRDDLKATLPTKQIAKLVAEGVLE